MSMKSGLSFEVFVSRVEPLAPSVSSLNPVSSSIPSTAILRRSSASSRGLLGSRRGVKSSRGHEMVFWASKLSLHPPPVLFENCRIRILARETADCNLTPLAGNLALLIMTCLRAERVGCVSSCREQTDWDNRSGTDCTSERNRESRGRTPLPP